MAELNLPQNYKDLLFSFLKNNVHTDWDVIFYGSRVNGGCHDGSDIDIVLRNKRDAKLKYIELNSLIEKIKQTNFPYLIDVMDWAIIPEKFKDQINKNCIIL